MQPAYPFQNETIIVQNFTSINDSQHRGDGSAENMIDLPTDAPFYLFKYGKSCQKVEGMSEMEQYFHFNEDVPSMQPTGRAKTVNGMDKYKKPHPKIDETGYDKGIALFYCYYDICKYWTFFSLQINWVFFFVFL